MSNSPGQRLLALLSRQLVNAFHQAASAIAGDLAALPEDPRFAGTPYQGRVREQLAPDHPVLAVLTALSADAGSAHVGLHGWRAARDDGASPGLAYVATPDPAVAVMLTVVPAEGPQLVLRAAGLAGHTIQVPVLDGFTLTITGTTTDEVEIVFHPDRPPTVNRLAAGTRIDFELSRLSAGERLGPESGPSVLFGGVSLGGYLGAGTDGSLQRGAHLVLKGGQVRLTPGYLEGLLPVGLSFPLDLDLALSTTAGITLGGSPSLSTRLTGSAGRWLDLVLDVGDAASPSLRVSFRTSLTVALPGAPVELRVDGLGLGLPVSLDVGTPLLPDPSGLVPALPDGAGVSLDLPVVGGSGTLMKLGADLAGALSVKIPPMTAVAFGLLSPGRDGSPLSFLVVMGATFPPPGVQVGFGFAVTGMGGVVGINRRIDRDALLRAVTDGTAAQLLFPSDPVGAGRAAIEALPRIFPAARGSVVAGPMFQLGWGGRIVALSAAVLVESSRQVRLTIVGKLVLAVPDPEAPLVFLQATFAGFVDAAEPSVLFVASLTGSHIVGVPLTGDVLLLTRGGPDPTLVISAGGFHPAFPLPRGVPALRRLSMDLCPVPWMSMRCENYFALTSNTLQFGVRMELSAEVAGCGLRGHFGFDALVQYSPFRFVADVSGGIALRVFGETLMGISLAFHLEGPAPYLARGRGSIDLFFFEVSFDFELGWGAPAEPVTARDAGADLRAALAAPAAWRSTATAPGLVLTAAAQKALSAATIVDPSGTVTARQEVVPLAVELHRYGGVPCPPQRWDLVGGEFGPGEPAHHTSEVRARFAPGQFVPSRSDDEALTADAFLPLRAGVELHPAPAAGAESRPAGLGWEEKVIARDIPVPVSCPVGIFAELVSIEALLTTGHDRWWTPPEEVIQVDPVPPAAAASAWSMTSTDVTAASMFEVGQVADLTILALEAWEL
jgi:hypothetical protein